MTYGLILTADAIFAALLLLLSTVDAHLFRLTPLA